MPRSIWSVLCSLCPLGNVQLDLGRAAAPPLPPSPRDASFWAVLEKKLLGRRGNGWPLPISQPLGALQAGFEVQYFSAVYFSLDLWMHRSIVLC